MLPRDNYITFNKNWIVFSEILIQILNLRGAKVLAQSSEPAHRSYAEAEDFAQKLYMQGARASRPG